MISPLTFAAAIRLGSMSSEKAILHRLLPNGSRCAIGAAELAAGLDSKSTAELAAGLESESSHAAERRWPFLWLCAENPVTGASESINVIVAGLNNGRYGEPWSRERIADWVETVEPKSATIDAVPAQELVNVS